MRVILLNRNDEAIADLIVSNLIDGSANKPSKEHLDSLLSDNRTYVFAALIDTDMVGYAVVYKFPSLSESKHLAYLYDIEVINSYRRKGVGRLLIEAILKQMKEVNVSELWLGTGVENIEGQALFSATGAIRSGETFNDFTYQLD